MIDVAHLQRRLGCAPDGALGPVTFAALFARLGAPGDTAAELGLAAAAIFPRAGWLDTPLRFAHPLAQLAHESGGFRYMQEIWGPTDAQSGYEGRADLGNVRAGDGLLYRGRGPIQITGRANYRAFGRAIGIDLERWPDLAKIPSIGLQVSAAYWASRGLNALADRDDLQAITRAINGGLTGLADRAARLAAVRALLA